MTIAIDRLKEVTRDFGRRHIAYQMARELLEIYSGNGPVVWNVLSDFPPEVNGIYGHSRFCNTDFDDKLACLNLSGV